MRNRRPVTDADCQFWAGSTRGGLMDHSLCTPCRQPPVERIQYGSPPSDWKAACREHADGMAAISGTFFRREPFGAVEEARQAMEAVSGRPVDAESAKAFLDSYAPGAGGEAGARERALEEAAALAEQSGIRDLRGFFPAETVEDMVRQLMSFLAGRIRALAARPAGEGDHGDV